MPSAMIQKAQVIENSGAVFMARIVRDDGDPILVDEIESITCNVFDAETETLISSPSLDPAENVFDELQITSAWTRDNEGFNFRASLSGDCWPVGGRWYSVEIKLDPIVDEYTGGNPIYIVWHVQALNILSE